MTCMPNRLSESSAQARRRTEEDQDFPRAHSPQHSGFAASAFPQQQPPLPPPLPPLPKLGPSAGEVAGIGIGIAAATAIGFIVLNRHSADNIVLDAGYQFEMVIGSPLVLDAGHVAAAIAASNAQ